VEAMIFHAASIAAFFVDSLAQTPVQIQSVQQSTPESWVKWLLQFALSIVPVAGGVGIALWSFHATSKREHERWILDQKKAEWSQLLRSVVEVHRVLRVVSTTEKERAELIAESLKPAIHELVIAQANCIFLQTLSADTKHARSFYHF
jgi:hypothetical protein